MRAMSFLFPRSLSRRLSLAFVALLVLLLCTTGLALMHERRIAATIARITDVDLERLWLISEINDHANDGARKLIVLLAAPRDLRVAAYAEIDAAHRRLDSAMVMLERKIDGGGSNHAYLVIVQCLRHYRSAYQRTADLIEADDLAGAQRSIVDRVDLELSMLMSATQSLDRAEREQLDQRLVSLRADLAGDRNLLLAMGLTGGLMALALTLWVMRGVARPLRAVGRAARRLAQGDYAHDLPSRSQDEVGDIVAAFGQLASDVQQREGALRHLIDFDALTGLVQRDRFIAEHAARASLAAQRRGEQLVLACFDIERLKTINALLGFDAGDEAIVQVARRASSVNLLTHGVARVGGGTFATLLCVDGCETPLQRAEAFRKQMEHSMTWRGNTLDLAVSVGVAQCPEHGETMPELLRRAEQALFDAKRQRIAVAQYSPSIEATRLGHLSLLSELQTAIERSELVPFLQPKVCLRTGLVVGAEALVRWRHPDRGWVPPADFIPFAESTGRITGITQYMLAQCIAMMGERLGNIKLAVNISTFDLRDPRFAEGVRALLEAHGVAPQRLQIEVTETGLLGGGDEPIQRLASLRKLGVGVSIDDFGTGQSSLAYLQRLPADELKIDRSFVHRADQDPGRFGLLTAVIGLAHGMGLTVTAEGAETLGELQVLREMGCDLVQGYVVSKPLPVDEFLSLYGPQLRHPEIRLA